jgi:hypothetical protein
VEKKVMAADAAEGLFELAPVALAVLRSKDNGASKLNKRDICAIAKRYLATDLHAELKKHGLVLTLKALMMARENVPPAAFLETGEAAAVAPHCSCDHGDRGHTNGRQQRRA